MKRRSILATMKISFSAVLLVFPSGAFAAATLGQASQNTKTALSTEEQELIRARRANEEAQAEYYREQTNKLRQPPTASPSPGKSFSQSVAENPASVVGVVGSILGALIIAIVGLTTLYFNNRNAIKAQRDTQFYEAMKRLGDKDSATIRASAAGLLALMAQVEWRELSLSNNWLSLKLIRSKPYFTTALDQLLTGLRLENNPVGIDSIKDALQQFVPHDPITITYRLHEANLRIQEELGSLLAEFFVIRRCETWPDADDQRRAELWDQLHQLTGYEDWIVKDLVRNNVRLFREKFESYLHIFRTQTSGDPGLLLSANYESLRVTSSRLRANVTLFLTALRSFRPQATPRASLRDSFLAGGNISVADLSGLDLDSSVLTGLHLPGLSMEGTSFIGAHLRSVNLSNGNLRKACLLGAQLEGADLNYADMTDAMLGNAKINSLTTFHGATWWKANFYTSNPVPEVDSDLLEKVYEQYREDVPADLNQVHPSVRTFLESKKATAEPEDGS